MTDQAPNAAPAYRILADRIAARILDGEIRPGDPLPTETVLSETYGVHRSTVREGIRLLEETGMLRRKSQKRLEVAVPDGSHLAERTAQALVMRGITVRALYEANLAFDPVLARIAAASASSAQITRLHRNLRDTRAATGDRARLASLDAEFHALVCEATNNDIFHTMRQPLHDLFLPMVSELVATIDTSARMLAAHEQIVLAIEKRDGALAALWAGKHIEDFRRGYLKAALDFDAPVPYDRGRPQ